MYFLSSSPPPQPSPFIASTSQQSHRPSFSQSHNHDNSYGRAHAKAYYAPHSPSPLRTTRNANLMPSPPQLKYDYPHSLLSSSPLRGGFSEHQDENRMESETEEENEISAADIGFHPNVQETPTGKMHVGTYGRGGHSSLFTPPDSGSNHNVNNSKILSHERSTFRLSRSIPASIGPPQPTLSTISGHQNQSQWELRSRSSSPTSLLTNQTNRNREQRKSRFLDRIRRRRDDDRSEQVGEQVLRMDFVKERRHWEREMARRAAMEAAQQEEMESEDDDDDDDRGEEELSPTQEYEEDIEVDELVREYEREHLQARRNDEFLIDEDEDEEYERLFREMEILSQHSQPQSQNQPASQPRPERYNFAHTPLSTRTKPTSFSQQPQQHGGTITDETMDLS
ncbi:hypothetical protein AYL99_11424 [Fonsecaea erecta]|uniref:Uncharacterized protein n=1 Tax=Fonsecaea erecta TaxID=1367422 RepID=A0A178Z564_9EURO|nr:hypothetical protein AYL99_11424 [Fonsecaea erecta]OAP54323.1 hypothetical protein AYL99_11424 [Fonsecaea erecta]